MHEAAHLILHWDEIQPYLPRSIEEARQRRRAAGLDFSEWTDEDWMEWQANSWAGLVLVPPRLLKTTFNNEYNNIIPKLIRAQKAGVPDNERIQYAYEYISEPLTDLFNVSKDVIRKRIERDKLLNPLPTRT